MLKEERLFILFRGIRPRKLHDLSFIIKISFFQLQLEITKKLGILAKHLGAETTRNELLPFIKENIDFHDEILLHLSEQLKLFIPLVGGYQHSQPVLEILMKLCNTDETMVRDKAVEILKDIGENLSNELTEELFVPVVEKLSNEDWFTSKCSAAALYSVSIRNAQSKLVATDCYFKD